MKLILGKRGSGKTTKAIANAYANNAIIITYCNKEASYVKEKAKLMGMDVDAVGIEKYLEEVKYGKYIGKKVVIDELDCVLNNLFHTKVLCCTSSCESEYLMGGYDAEEEK